MKIIIDAPMDFSKEKTKGDLSDEEDLEMDNNETLMHQESAAGITWAVFDANDSCVAVGGHDPEYYASSGCVNL